MITGALAALLLAADGGTSGVAIVAVDGVQAETLAKGLTERVLLPRSSPHSDEPTLALFAIEEGAMLQMAAPDRDAVCFVLEGQVRHAGKRFERGGYWLTRAGDPIHVVALQRARVLVASARATPRKDRLRPRQGNAREAAALAIAGGKGEARILVEADAALSASTLSFDPGAAVPEHAHPAEFELLFMVEGAGALTVEGEVHPVGPGTALRIPPGVRHAFQVTSGTAVKAVQFYTPPGPEQRFKPKTP